MKSLFVTGLAVIACLSAGCESTNSIDIFSEDDTYAIHTADEVYKANVSKGRVELQEPIRFSFTNNLSQTVYVSSCREPHPPKLEKWIDGVWVFAFRPVLVDCVTEPIEIGPGNVYEHAFRVSAGRPGHPRVFSQWAPAEIDGLYRLVWNVYQTRTSAINEDAGALIPFEQRTSNPFRITV